MKITNQLIFFLILFTAIILRLVYFFDIPYTYDEFSALFRTHFDNFSDLIEKGVKIDGHPAGVQVFMYYWTQLFGYTEWLVKLPFIILSLLGIWFLYKTIRLWHNETVALISIAFAASIQYMVMYSVIARPYISGFFFSMAMIYFWSNLILKPHERFFKNATLFILFASLNTYNHHFSLLFTAIVGIIGLFAIQKKFFIKYVIANIFILLLYIPHLPIFFYQLNVGGVEMWLAKPKPDFLFKYLTYLFHFSNYVIGLVILLIAFGFIQYKKTKWKHYLIFSLLFFLPYIIGYLYSIKFSAVLQFSLLIFSFPFLFFIIFGHIKEQKPIVNFIIVSLILLTNTITLIYERQHYKLFYHPLFKGIVKDYASLKLQSPNSSALIDSNKKMTSYYINKLKVDSNFTWFSGLPKEKDLISFLMQAQQKNDTLFLACNSQNRANTILLIEDYFPKLLKETHYLGGSSYIFSSGSSQKENLISFIDFKQDSPDNWENMKLNNIIDTQTSEKAYLIDTIWSPSYLINFEELSRGKNDFIDISAQVMVNDPSPDFLLVASIDNNEGNLYWNGAHILDFISENKQSNQWINLHLTIKLSDLDINESNSKLKVYIWNKSKNTLLLKSIRIKLRKGNPYLYSSFENIDD